MCFFTRTYHSHHGSLRLQMSEDGYIGQSQILFRFAMSRQDKKPFKTDFGLDSIAKKRRIIKALIVTLTV